MVSAAPAPTVLQLGPLYNNHLRRWSAFASALGCTVYAAGHVRPGRRPVDLAGVADFVEFAPERLYGLPPGPHLVWLRDLIQTLDPDLIHAHWLLKWAYFSVLVADRPVVVTAWGSDFYLAGGPDRRRANYAMRYAGGVLALSEHMRRGMIARGVSADRIYTADLGVDLDRFRPASPDERAQARNMLGLPPGPLILSMRAGTGLYNLDIVLEAFRIVRAGVPDATLVLLRGDAPAVPRVRAALDRLGHADGVWDLGGVPYADMAAYVQAADAAVSIPSSDGSPQSVWEALAGGVPVVLSDLPQVAERVGDSGGVQVVAQRPEPLATALIALLDDLPRRRRMAHAARGWAEANVGERPQIELLRRAYASTAQRWADAAR